MGEVTQGRHTQWSGLKVQVALWDHGVFVQGHVWVWSTSVGTAAVWPRGWSVMATLTALTTQMRQSVLAEAQVSPGTFRNVCLHPRVSLSADSIKSASKSVD